MQRSLEQRYTIKFRAKLGKSGSETLHLLRTAHGDVVLCSSQVLRWHKAFKDRRESVEDKQRAGRPSTSKTENNVAYVKAVLDRDRRFSARLMAEEVGPPKTDVHRIITEDLHMRKIANTWFLHHNNAPSHTSFAVREFLVQHNITVLPYPQYSLDYLARCDFFLFSKLGTHLKGHHFGTVENVQAAATRDLNNISSENFLHCYENWQQHWNRCIRSQGAYFEVDKL
jgi:hypothetical protein